MAQKGKTKLRDLGRFKSGEKIKARAEKAASMGYRTLDEQLRLKEKAANERMRQLEKRGIKSPAYLAAQAKLEVLGKQTKGDRGRRFSETGKGTYNERALLNKILDEFLGYETSTAKGAREYEEQIWSSANKNNKLSDAGISRGEWLSFWESMPDKKDRLFGSSFNVAILRAYTVKRDKIANMTDKERENMIKNGELTEEQLTQFMDNTYSAKDIAAEIEAHSTLKAAYKSLGISESEFNAAKIKKARK